MIIRNTETETDAFALSLGCPFTLKWHRSASDVPIQRSDEVELSSLKNGDRLIIRTLHTEYRLTMRMSEYAELETDRADRIRGVIGLKGYSSDSKGALFCGGNLEYTSHEGAFTHTTSTIRSIYLLHQSGLRSR